MLFLTLRVISRVGLCHVAWPSGHVTNLVAILNKVLQALQLGCEDVTIGGDGLGY